MRKENKMRSEVQKQLNDLYHQGVDVKLINSVVSYIELLEAENTKLIKKLGERINDEKVCEEVQQR